MLVPMTQPGITKLLVMCIKISPTCHLLQPQRPTVENAGIQPLAKIEESLAVKKPETTGSRLARAAYEPIELPSTFASGLFKVRYTVFNSLTASASAQKFPAPQ